MRIAVMSFLQTIVKPSQVLASFLSLIIIKYSTLRKG